MKIYKVTYWPYNDTPEDLIGYYTSIETVKKIKDNPRWSNKIFVKEFESDLTWAEGKGPAPYNAIGLYINNKLEGRLK